MKQTRTIVVTLDHVDIYRGPLILVNRDNPVGYAIPESKLALVAPGVQLEKQTALLYETVIREVRASSQIVPVSGYRDWAEQEAIYADALAQHGQEYTSTYVALPGCSEHQTGLAIDVGKASGHIDFITPDFPYVGIYQKFRQAAVRYGFIQRYPEGKEAITGIGHEPWHFRYVGIPHAELITQLDFALEEYHQWIRAFPLERPYRFDSGSRAFAVGFVPAGEDVTEIALHGEPYTISGNNRDGFIVAVWGGVL